MRTRWLVPPLLLLLSSASFAQTRSPLEITLHTTSTKVTRDQTIPVQVILRNVDERQRVVLRGEPGFSEAGGIELSASDQRGAATRLDRSRGAMSLREAQEGDRRVVLAPGESLGVHRRIHVGSVFRTPGTYTLKALYQSPVPAERNPSIDARNIEGSRAESAGLTIEVTE